MTGWNSIKPGIDKEFKGVLWRENEEVGIIYENIWHFILSSSTVHPPIKVRNVAAQFPHFFEPRGILCGNFYRGGVNDFPDVSKGTVEINTLHGHHKSFNTSDDKHVHQDMTEKQWRT